MTLHHKIHYTSLYTFFQIIIQIITSSSNTSLWWSIEFGRGCRTRIINWTQLLEALSTSFQTAVPSSRSIVNSTSHYTPYSLIAPVYFAIKPNDFRRSSLRDSFKQSGKSNKRDFFSASKIFHQLKTQSPSSISSPTCASMWYIVRLGFSYIIYIACGREGGSEREKLGHQGASSGSSGSWIRERKKNGPSPLYLHRCFAEVRSAHQPDLSPSAGP